jgi:hypothetical protein
MARGTGLYGYPKPYLPTVGQDIYDADDLPPVTAALRAAWGNAGSPTATAEFAAAALVAVKTLEDRIAALEAG